MRNKEKHREYINSDLWKAKREEALAYHGHRCASCGTTENIQVHHISYLRLSHNGPGKETMEDLIPLCGRPHQLVHKLITELKERNKNIPGYNWEKASKEAIGFIKSSEAANLRRQQRGDHHSPYPQKPKKKKKKKKRVAKSKCKALKREKQRKQNKKELELLNHKKRPFLSKEEFDKFMSNKTLNQGKSYNVITDDGTSVAVYYTK